MGHLGNAKKEVYRALAERLNKNPIGAPLNEVLMQILQRLYSETEAMVGSKFSLRPMTLDHIAEVTGIKENQLLKILDEMAEKGLVLDLSRRGTTYYLLAPMVIGFFEYTFMRAGDELTMKELAQLFEIYFQQPEVRQEFYGSETKMFRALVYETLIPAVVETEVLSYERASEIIRQSGGGAISFCSCRHKAKHLGKACDAPLEVCTSLGAVAPWLIRRGLGRPATVDEMLRVLDRTEKLGLVHLGDNVLNGPAYICHCCGCCCEVLRPIKETGMLSLHPSNFIPALNQEECIGCGVCAERCKTGAFTLTADNGGEEIPQFKRGLCIGCGACAAACPTQALSMERRSEVYLPPATKQEQFALIAQEKGRR